jgi:3-deoxy-manno-octulosonate cytidylyltransferase (CMP-KDO synthetase)
MNVLGIIPARMNSSRFPGKPMMKIAGMPMIEHCFHRTSLSNGISSTYVATCDKVIFDYIVSIGGKAVMTSDKHKRATTRTAEAVQKIEEQENVLIDIVVMVQGDEPLIRPETISELLSEFKDIKVNIVNVMSRIYKDEHFKDVNNVKVVVDNNNDALYFSREGIPSSWCGFESLPMFMQTGIIAFRRNTLIEFNALPESPLEIIESIDMNRVLETGGKVRMVGTDQFTLGIDTPSELTYAETMMVKDDTFSRYSKKL